MVTVRERDRQLAAELIAEYLRAGNVEVTGRDEDRLTAGDVLTATDAWLVMMDSVRRMPTGTRRFARDEVREQVLALGARWDGASKRLVGVRLRAHQLSGG